MTILTHKLTLHFQKAGNLAAYKVLGVAILTPLIKIQAS